MTVAEAAKLLEVSPKTIYDLCRTGLIGHLRIGTKRGTIRIEPEDVERFRVEARAKGANPSLVRYSVKPPPPAVRTPPPRVAYHTFKHIKPRD
jgi:excisionase family DNA binding protein